MKKIKKQVINNREFDLSIEDIKKIHKEEPTIKNNLIWKRFVNYSNQTHDTLISQ